MLDIMLHEMEGLSPEEKRKLIDATEAAVARELGQAAGDAAPEACPWCGSSSFIRKGHNRDGSQRRLCRECGRTFPARSRGLLAASKPDAATWSLFVESALSGRSPRECARACRVCLSTSWFCRMRLCEVMEGSLLPFRTGPSVSWQVDGTYLDESLTGNRARSAAGMPRAPRRHGGAVHARGISGLKACIVCGADDAGDGSCRLADRSRPGTRPWRRQSGTSVPAPGRRPTPARAAGACSLPSASPGTQRPGRACRRTASSAW